MEMTPTWRRNYQRCFGRAQRTLSALDKGLVRPEQLIKIPRQLQRTVQILTANPINTVRQPSTQLEPMQPRPNIFSRMAAHNASMPVAKKMSVFERLDPFLVQRFKNTSIASTVEVAKSNHLQILLR